MAYPTDYEDEELEAKRSAIRERQMEQADYIRDRKKDDEATDRWHEQIAKVRVALGCVINQDAIELWLRTPNDVFGCRPIDMVGTHREHEIYRMIERLESGEPA